MSCQTGQSLDSFNRIPQVNPTGELHFFPLYVMGFTKCQRRTFANGRNSPSVQPVSGCFVREAPKHFGVIGFILSSEHVELQTAFSVRDRTIARLHRLASEFSTRYPLGTQAASFCQFFHWSRGFFCVPPAAGQDL